jgi:hypothetical protein
MATSPHDNYETYNTRARAQSSSGDIDIGDIIRAATAGRGRGALKDIYTENRDYNKMLTDEAYDRSLGWDMEGPAGSTTFDRETQEMLAEFSPEMQQLYDGWLRAEQRAGDELGAYDMDERTIKQIGMFDAASAGMDRRNQQRADELAFAQGIGGTQQYYQNLSLGEQVNQRRLQEALKSREMAMGERNLLRAEQLAFGNSAIDAPRTLFRQAELGLKAGQGSHTGVNMAGNALSSMALADTQAGFWSGLMGGMSNYGGGSSSSNKGSGSSGGGDFLSSIMSMLA